MSILDKNLNTKPFSNYQQNYENVIMDEMHPLTVCSRIFIGFKLFNAFEKVNLGEKLLIR